MSNDPTYFDQKITHINREVGNEIDFFGKELDNDDYLKLAEAMRDNAKIVRLRITEKSMQDFEQIREGFTALMEALKNNETLISLEITNLGIDNQGALQAAASFAENRSLRSVSFENNQIGEEGGIALVESFGSNPHITRLRLQDNPLGEEANSAAEKTFIDGEHHNILVANGLGDRMISYGTANRLACEEVADFVMDININNKGNVGCWIDVVRQESAILHHCVDEGGMLTSKMNLLKQLFAKLPTFDPAEQNIITAFTREDEEGYTALDNPYTWINLEETVASLNENGRHIRCAELLDEKGEANAIFTKAIEIGEVKALFQYSNWKGASVDDLRAVLQAMPQDELAAIPNRQQLLTSLTRQTEMRER